MNEVAIEEITETDHNSQTMELHNMDIDDLTNTQQSKDHCQSTSLPVAASWVRKKMNLLHLSKRPQNQIEPKNRKRKNPKPKMWKKENQHPWKNY